MKDTKQNFNSVPLQNHIDSSEALSYIAAGVVCYAFSLIDEMGILDSLFKEKKLYIRSLSSYPNPLVLRAAFETLEKNGIVKYFENYLSLTKMGIALYRNRGSIGLIYNGYRNILSNQLSIATDEPSQNWALVDSLAVSKASVYFGEKVINELISNAVINCDYNGICDLGCGEAQRLMYICRKMRTHGLGIDISRESIQKGIKNLKKTDKIKLAVKDITKLNEVYPDIEILLQSFVMHDLTVELLQKTLRSLLLTFPNLKRFIYIDSFAADGFDKQLPGFDYIHSLLNIKTRTRKETVEILQEAGFIIEKEVPIPELINCFMLVLSPAFNNGN